ncbi:hypothetical protein KHA94_22265 [Bacillus sp. FJAT-49705]|uniref:Lipoprotein n=1 Tax=Cytobacillus citreus TaxID=2833586 RepID=A0ABS5P0D6_9BACI|nr:hypothetical protein [Cytobacillus citreus]MBS4192858.1 hypothetical protein [Cytobacillus citreus]
MPKFIKGITAICFSVLMVTGCSGNQTGSNTSPLTEGEGEIQSQEEQQTTATNLKVKNVKQLGNDGFTELGELKFFDDDSIDIGERIIGDKLYTYVSIMKDEKSYLSITNGDKWLVKDKLISDDESIILATPTTIAKTNKDSRIVEGEAVDKTLYLINEKGEIETESGIPYYDEPVDPDHFDSSNTNYLIKTSQGLALVKSKDDENFETINLETGKTINTTDPFGNTSFHTSVAYINYEENMVLLDYADSYRPYYYKEDEVIEDGVYPPEDYELIGSIGDNFYYMYDGGINIIEHPEKRDLYSYSLQTDADSYETTLDLLPTTKELIAHQFEKKLRIYNITDYEGIPSIQMITLEK